VAVVVVVVVEDLVEAEEVVVAPLGMVEVVAVAMVVVVGVVTGEARTIIEESPDPDHLKDVENHVHDPEADPRIGLQEGDLDLGQRKEDHQTGDLGKGVLHLGRRDQLLKREDPKKDDQDQHLKKGLVHVLVLHLTETDLQVVIVHDHVPTLRNVAVIQMMITKNNNRKMTMTEEVVMTTENCNIPAANTIALCAHAQSIVTKFP